MGGNGSACGEYQHAKGQYVSSPSISISASGISVGVSTSYVKYYSKVTNNPAVTFQFIICILIIKVISLYCIHLI